MSALTRLCCRCDGPFTTTQAEIDHGKGLWCGCKAKKRSASDQRARKGAKVARTCLMCARGFTTTQYQVDRGYGKYCTVACANKARARATQTRQTSSSHWFKWYGDGISDRNALPGVVQPTNLPRLKADLRQGMVTAWGTIACIGQREGQPYYVVRAADGAVREMSAAVVERRARA